MKAEALPWLLERSDPSVRMLTLTDVMGKSARDEEVKKARQSVVSSRPAVLLKKAQGGRGYWPPGETSYNPKFTSTVWQLMLLGELGVPRAPWIESAVERFLAQHQMENGALSATSKEELAKWRKEHGGKGKREEEPCLTGNMLRTFLVFGYGDDKRIKKSLDWLPEFQLEDGGWNCDYPSKRPTHSSFMSTIETSLGLLGDSKTSVDAEAEECNRAGRRVPPRPSALQIPPRLASCRVARHEQTLRGEPCHEVPFSHVLLL